jgi:hypothetical protein
LLLYAFTDPTLPPEEGAQWQLGELGARVPRGHIQAGDGDHGQTLINRPSSETCVPRRPTQMGQLLAPRPFTEVLEYRKQIRHRINNIGLWVTVPGHTLSGVQLDENQRPYFNRANPIDDRSR